MTHIWRNPVWPEELELQDDLSPSDWLLPRLLPSILSRADGTPVCSLVPTGFQAYVRVLHPAGDGRGRSVRWSEVTEVNGRIYHPLMQWRQIKGPEVVHVSERLFWDPLTGRPTTEVCQALYGTLAHWTSTPETCWVGIWEGFGSLGAPSRGAVAVARFSSGSDHEAAEDPDRAAMMASSEAAADKVRRSPKFHHPARGYLLARGPCSAVCELTRPPLLVTPSIAWPDDHAWCVASEIDFDSTLVAASRKCADALLADDQLETVEVNAEDRLDVGGDTLNPPVPY